jgi:Bacterial nucleoid DNA-binding protein
MSKATLVSNVASKAGISQDQARAAVDAVIGTFTEAAAAGEKFTVPGFLSLDVVKQEARTGRNPATGAAMEIAASNRVSLKAGAALKAAANPSK